ncbi:hypothetical protein MLD38_031419 [Melastoma candidum]|uniref:Uncharacterized protein n=1 Tax=Melastoma candidum TaxID=119954 RepID=A0ACB9MPM1_9MYRT|nr:hypothetical protein MLD38_031419 [Melastoma candidum]
MLRIFTRLIPHILLIIFSCSTVLGSPENDDRRDYIVYMGKLPDRVEVGSARYEDLLSQVLGRSFVPGTVTKIYKRSFNGFVAKLTKNEADKLKGQQGVVSVFPDRILQLHTTRSWDFLMPTKKEPRRKLAETNIIIGVVDTGIWPESESFGDAGLGPVPKKWKGVCNGGQNFTCNRKIIGARFYGSELDARDNQGSKTTAVGHSVNGFPSTGNIPVVYGKDAGQGTCDEALLKSCAEGCLAVEKVWKKILVCDNVQFGTLSALDSGAAGLIGPTSTPDVAFVKPIPFAALSTGDYSNFLSYLNQTRAPKANLLKSETVDDPTAPLVASFSSSGPNYNFPDIMKPDVTAPGVDILAAFSPRAPPSNSAGDTRRVSYNVLSGTSMSCPHVAGVAAYVKSFHPDWSPSIIKSAIMTTARPLHQNGSKEFSYGSGHVDPTKALEPGLVYEITNDDYVKLLCTLGINAAAITGKNVSCSKLPKLNAKDVNYPSVVLAVNASQPFSFNITRTVLNVGPPHSTYNASIVAHPGVKVAVFPRTLHFESSGLKKTFSVSVSGVAPKQGEVLSSSLVWSDGGHVVRSPIVVYSP